jgi:hypothetical protein
LVPQIKVWTEFIISTLSSKEISGDPFKSTSMFKKSAKSLRPKLKISLFPLTRPTLSKSANWFFFIGNLSSLFFSRFAQNLFGWKFRILDSFRQNIDIFALPSTSLSSKKKVYLPTHFQNCGSGKGKQKYF